MSVDLDTVVIHPNQMEMKQPVDMKLFRITHHDFDYKNATDIGDGIRMNIKMKRKIVSEVMTTLFPSLLLLLITCATTFFKPVFFEAALSVNLTTMLVMTTIFISKMEGLPPTSDTKMIDLWLILCQLVPFAEVVLLTAMEYIREEEEGTIKADDTEKTMTVISMEVDEGEIEAASASPVVEAWTAPGKRGSKVASISHLRIIGE